MATGNPFNDYLAGLMNGFTALRSLATNVFIKPAKDKIALNNFGAPAGASLNEIWDPEQERDPPAVKNN